MPLRWIILKLYWISTQNLIYLFPLVSRKHSIKILKIHDCKHLKKWNWNKKRYNMQHIYIFVLTKKSPLKWATDYDDNDDDVEGDKSNVKKSISWLFAKSIWPKHETRATQSSTCKFVSPARQKKNVILTFWSSMSVQTVPLIFD